MTRRDDPVNLFTELEDLKRRLYILETHPQPQANVACKITTTLDINIVHNAIHTITWNSEILDTHGFFTSPSTNIFPPVTGYYLINSLIERDPGGNVTLELWKSSETVGPIQKVRSSVSGSVPLIGIHRFIKGEHAQIRVDNFSGQTVSVEIGAVSTFFEMSLFRRDE